MSDALTPQEVERNYDDLRNDIQSLKGLVNDLYERQRVMNERISGTKSIEEKRDVRDCDRVVEEEVLMDETLVVLLNRLTTERMFYQQWLVATRAFMAGLPLDNPDQRRQVHTFLAGMDQAVTELEKLNDTDLTGNEA